jgi:hypothetical protein
MHPKHSDGLCTHQLELEPLRILQSINLQACTSLNDNNLYKPNCHRKSPTTWGGGGCELIRGGGWGGILDRVISRGYTQGLGVSSGVSAIYLHSSISTTPQQVYKCCHGTGVLHTSLSDLFTTEGIRSVNKSALVNKSLRLLRK